MNARVIDFYKKMNSNGVKNRIDSQYWIYEINSEIKRVNGLSKRFIQVFFFNRYFNENENLMRLYLLVNGQEIQQDRFSKMSTNDPNVLAFILEVDLAEEGKDVEIIGYIQDGKKIDLKGDYVKPFTVNDAPETLRILKLYEFSGQDKEVNVLPKIDEDHWICMCGNYNPIEDTYCKVCATKLEEARRIANIDQKSLILNNINKVIKREGNETVDDMINRYVYKFQITYGFSKEEILEHINRDELIKNNGFNNSINTGKTEAISDNGSASYDSQTTEIHVTPVDNNPPTKNNKLIMIAGVIIGIIILVFLVQSLMEPYLQEQCYEKGGLWINGACEMFNEGF
ncbi:hypothetical protein [Faecalicoccus acidiformans]|uniref:hypothetical protein n=1 Tax=Faecalicoccus acidiformans TaxID=915173 RepID=UPI0032083215